MKYHRKHCLRKDKLGMLAYWGWKKCYVFLNFDTGKYQLLAEKDIEKKVTFLEKEEYDKMYAERNYPDNIFDNRNDENYKYNIFKGDKSAYTERQQRYGLIHDNLIKLCVGGSKMTNGFWSAEACRAFAYMITSYQFWKMILEKYGSEEKAQESLEEYRELVMKYFMSPEDVYMQNCDLVGMQSQKMTEEELIQHINKLAELPKEYQDKILQGKRKNALCNEPEFIYYRKLSVLNV